MRKAKDICLCLALLACSWAAVEAARAMREIAATTDNFSVVGAEVLATVSEIRSAASEVRGYNAALASQLSDPKTQRGIGLLLRSGDDLSRTIKRANGFLENLNDAIRDTSTSVNGRLVPVAVDAIERTSDTVNAQALAELARTLQATTETVTDAGDGIRITSAALAEAMDGVNRSVASIEARVNDPRMDAIVGNIDTTTDRAAATMLHVEQKTRELTRPVAWIWRGIRSAAVVVGRIFIP